MSRYLFGIEEGAPSLSGASAPLHDAVLRPRQKISLRQDRLGFGSWRLRRFKLRAYDSDGSCANHAVHQFTDVCGFQIQYKYK